MNQAYANNFKMELNKRFERLSDFEKKVIDLKYGFLDGVERTVEEIAEKTKVSIDKVKETIVIALRKLR